jgi:hypothetical protein
MLVPVQWMVVFFNILIILMTLFVARHSVLVSANVAVVEDAMFLQTLNLLYLIYMLLKELPVVYFQMKERELDYKKCMDQLLKDKEDANRQLKMMQEGEEFGSVYRTHWHHLLGHCVKE